MPKIKLNTILAVCCLFNVTTYCQSGANCKYQTVLSYLRTNIKINDKIKVFFENLVNKDDKFVEFNLSKRIEFLSIDNFKDSITASKCGIPESLIKNWELFYKKYFFESYSSSFLEHAIDLNDSKIYLTFSKPIGNFLVAELLSTNPEQFQKRKLGKAIRFLILFNAAGLVENVYYSGAAYN